MAERSCGLNGKLDRQALLEVREYFDLPSAALVEKDWHVVQALAAIHDAASDGLTLAFGGGTALGRAYGLLQRMSEDIDLRVIGDKATARPALRRLRRQVSERLRERGFAVDEDHVTVQHNDTYVRYDLPYDPIMRGEGVLRPEIKIEISAFPTRRPLIDRTVASFVAEANKAPAEIPNIACVNLVEIAAEKFVALTRRGGAAFAGHEALDRTLPRHVYDLSRLYRQYDVEDAARLALETMRDDAATRGDDFPAYHADPPRETLRAVKAMAGDHTFAARYSILMDAMVYGEKPSFDNAMDVVWGLAGRVAAEWAQALSPPLSSGRAS
jgi:predicted nucleotidyltransferase component of viral defense system